MTSAAPAGSSSLAPGGVSRRDFIRIGAVGGTALATSGIAAACGATTTAKKRSLPKHVQIPFYSGEDDPKTIAIVNKAIAAFERAHPGAKIQQITQQGGESAIQQLEAGIHSGQDMGVMILDPSQVVSFISGDFLYPLDSLIKGVGKDQFPTGTRVVVGGHDWVYPHVGGPYMIWYRTDLMSSAPKSVHELKQAASENRKGSEYGIVLPTGSANAFTDTFPGFIWSQGGDYYDPNGKCIFGSDRVRAGIENYVKLLKDSTPGNGNLDPKDMIAAYLSGRVAMAMYPGRLGVNMVEQGSNLIDRTAVAPGATYGPVNIKFIRWDYLGVYKRTANPELAMEFIKTLMTGPIAVEYCNSVPGQTVSANKTVREATFKKAPSVVSQHPQWFQAINAAIPRSNSLYMPIGAVSTGEFKPYNGPPAPWASTAWGDQAIDMQMIQKIALQGMSVKDGQAWATEQFTSVAKQYIDQHPNWRHGKL